MTFQQTLQHEFKTRLGRPAALASLVLLVVILGQGAVSGRRHRDDRRATIAAHETEVMAAMERWRQELEAWESRGPGPGVRPWAGSPMDVVFASALPPAPLGDFAVGQSDLLPFFGKVSLWQPDLHLFTKTAFDDPVSLALGSFDLGKGILIFLPLLLIVLCFDVVSADRDANRLGLVLAQGVALRRLFWRRLLIRAASVAALVSGVAGVALLWPNDGTALGQRLPFFALWAAGAGLYTGFWVALCAVVASGRHSGAVSLVVLMLAWAGLTLVVPAGVVAVSEAVYPPPSRVAYLARARQVENEAQLARADLGNRFLLDHPELQLDDTSEIPEYVRTAFLVTGAVDAATQPILEAFEATARSRDQSLSGWQYLSPAIITHRLFNAATGTSAGHHRRYQAAARALKAEYAAQVGAQVVAGRRLVSHQAADLPRLFLPAAQWRQVLRRHAAALVALALLTGLLFGVADRRLRRLQDRL